MRPGRHRGLLFRHERGSRDDAASRRIHRRLDTLAAVHPSSDRAPAPPPWRRLLLRVHGVVQRSERFLRRAGRKLRKLARQPRKRAWRAKEAVAWAIQRPDLPLWRVLRGPRLRLGLYRDDIERVLHGLTRTRKPVSFVLVGANDGVENDMLHPFVRAGGWSGILVEPLPHLFGKLQQNLRGTPGLEFANVAIDRTPGMRELFYVEDLEGAPWYADKLGSFSREHVRKHGDSIPDIDERIASRLVECITLDSLCERHGVTRLDLVQIDAEGFDFEVIRSIDFQRLRPSVLIYEHAHLGVDEEACRRFLEELGYRVIRGRLDSMALADDVRTLLAGAGA